MNANLLKAKRVECNLKQKDMAKILRVSVKTYWMKENSPICTFSGNQILILKDILNLTFEEINLIFFDGRLSEN